ncbi:MAG: RecB family exonuclease [Acidimicrobiales bacterium]
MALPLPVSLSPSKVSTFKDCALAFRLSSIDRLPEPPSEAAAKGTLVHRALELLMFEEEPGGRGIEVAMSKLDRALGDVLDSGEYAELELQGEAREAFREDAAALIRNYYQLEDPNSVRVIGTELRLGAPLGNFRVSGIIDRLDLDADGELVVIDYKTGRAPGVNFEQPRMLGVSFYAFLCQTYFGRMPKEMRLLHLREPVSITTVPTEQSVTAMRRQTLAVWAAVERACADESFRPRPGRCCSWCGFRAYCPAWGGDLAALPPLIGRDGPPVQEPLAVGAA